MTSESKNAEGFKLQHTAGVAVSDDEILADMKRVASELGRGVLPARLYESHGKYSHTTASKRFGSWNAALTAAGLSLLNEVDIPDEDLFHNIEHVWVTLGRQPRKREMSPPTSKYSERPYARRFGSWRRALEAFVGWAETESSVPSFDPSSPGGGRGRTSRDPNLALRFRVMRRDSFTCRHCGKSPARDPNVQLHVDHVIPWSAGGDTTLENLQTLCSECNLGKGTQHQQADG